jgi:hypothetical protein
LPDNHLKRRKIVIREKQHQHKNIVDVGRNEHDDSDTD